MSSNNRATPEPLGERRYSGKFNVGTSPSLHRELVIRAATEGISLNALVNQRLSSSYRERAAPFHFPHHHYRAEADGPGCGVGECFGEFGDDGVTGATKLRAHLAVRAAKLPDERTR